MLSELLRGLKEKHRNGPAKNIFNNFRRAIAAPRTMGEVDPQILELTTASLAILASLDKKGYSEAIEIINSDPPRFGFGRSRIGNDGAQAIQEVLEHFVEKAE